MPLSDHTQLGPYEILAPIGAGGMGEVYRARDSKLGRDVALKVLPTAFAADPERLARFRREAQVLASLNHPHIAAIYGFEDSGSTHALVMELVEGPTLADRIARGPIPLDEALPIAKQIAEALEAAHDRGIIHRDLKPANIKITADGIVKVLDFGLAKAVEGDSSAIDLQNSPTISRMATQAGIILGTAAYMSPEQAKGKSVDRRTDIWAFGCVLFEMLSGKRAFDGETVTDTLAAVIRAEPDWALLPPDTPQTIRNLLGRCLKKDPKQRLQAIGEARIALDENSGANFAAANPDATISAAAPAQPAPRWRTALPWVLAGIAILFSLLAPYSFRRSGPGDSQQVLRYTIPPPADSRFDVAFALSPDGTRLVFGAIANGKTTLRLRNLNSLAAEEIPGTDGGVFPFWSPDGKSIAFFAEGKLKRLDLSGGTVQTLCSISSTTDTFPRGAAWSPAGFIVYSPSYDTPLMKVPAAGGTPVAATAFEKSRHDDSHRWPAFLPDGRHFLFFDRTIDQTHEFLEVGSLDSAEVHPLFESKSAAVYAGGYLFFSRDGNLLVQPFDASHLRLSGDPVSIAEDVHFIGETGATNFLPIAVSETGVLLYRTGLSNLSQITIFDRAGKAVSTVGPPGTYYEPALSPDAKKLAISIDDPRTHVLDIWTIDLATSAFTRLTFDSQPNTGPVWSPDGRWIYYSSARSGIVEIYKKLADGSGTAEPVVQSGALNRMWDFSRDGRFLLYNDHSPQTNDDIWMLPLNPPGKATPVLNSPDAEIGARLSPDGRWIVYLLSEENTLAGQIFVAAFPPTGARWQVSNGTGYWPVWRDDGRELFYFTSGVSPDLMSVEIVPGATFQAKTAKPLFKIDPAEYYVSPARSGFVVFPGGQKFLVNQIVSTGGGSPLTVLSNWRAVLTQR